ncbi:unnamed protein product, partial [Nesidiocoris tenuis]
MTGEYLINGALQRFVWVNLYGTVTVNVGVVGLEFAILQIVDHRIDRNTLHFYRFGHVHVEKSTVRSLVLVKSKDRHP